MSDSRKSEEMGLGKRDSFLADLRDEAGAKGLMFEVSKRRGKEAMRWCASAIR